MHTEAREFLNTIDERAEHGNFSNQSPNLFDFVYHSSLPAQEKTLNRLAEEAFVVITAGGDTVARALTCGIYHLVSNPLYLDRLREELTKAEIHFQTLHGRQDLHKLVFLVKL